MRQETYLNRTEQPERREQGVALPTTVASGSSVVALSDRVTAVEAITDQLEALSDYADDTAAAAGGVAVGEFYRNGSVVMIRVS